MENNHNQAATKPEGKLGRMIQVRLVKDLKKSQEYYRDILGCQVDGWGHAEKDEMVFILQQAKSPNDVRPNTISQKRDDYPTEWRGPDHSWDTYIHTSWDYLDHYIEEVRSKGGIIAVEPFTDSHGDWEFKNAIIQDLDGYNLTLGAMRPINTDH